MNDRMRALLGRTPSTQTHNKPKEGERPPTTPDEEHAIVREHYSLGVWNGLPNYVCKACGAGFLEQQAAVDHWLAQHSDWSPPPDTDIVDTGLVTPSGSPVYKEVVVDHATKEADE